MASSSRLGAVTVTNPENSMSAWPAMSACSRARTSSYSWRSDRSWIRPIARPLVRVGDGFGLLFANLAQRFAGRQGVRDQGQGATDSLGEDDGVHEVRRHVLAGPFADPQHARVPRVMTQIVPVLRDAHRPRASQACPG